MNYFMKDEDKKDVIIIQENSIVDPENEKETLFYKIRMRYGLKPTFQIILKPFYKTKGMWKYKQYTDFLEASEFGFLLRNTYSDLINSDIVNLGERINHEWLRIQSIPYEVSTGLFDDIRNASSFGLKIKREEVDTNDIDKGEILYCAFSALHKQLIYLFDICFKMRLREEKIIELTFISLTVIEKMHPKVDFFKAREIVEKLVIKALKKYNTLFKQ